MSDVIDISSKLERWIVAFRRPGLTVRDELEVKVSNHGRLMLTVGQEHQIVSCVEMVTLVTGIVRAMAEHGFPPTPPDPPADTQFQKGR